MTTLQPTEYVDEVKSRLFDEHRENADNYENFAYYVIRDCYNNGFSITDAARYARCWEEINPDLDEDIACARMRAIREKYGIIGKKG